MTKADSLKAFFFQLLRRGLWSDQPEKTCLVEKRDDASWEAIYQIARKHTVEGILFDSFQFLSSSVLPSDYLLVKWAGRVDQIERRNDQMNTFIASQWKWFQQHDLNPLLLKGQALAQTYAVPPHRISGDIDWHFDEKSYQRVIKLLIERGQDFKSEGRRSLSYVRNGIIVEHHKDVFNVTNPFLSGFLNKFLKESLVQHNRAVIADQQIQILSPCAQIVQVNIHILKHLLAFGIGLRQFCDAARAYSYYKGQYDAQELKSIYQRMEVFQWTHYLHDVLVKHLGLPEEDLPYPIPKGIQSDWMIDEVWESGNFGFHDDRYKNGKKNLLSIRPGSLERVWRSFWQYCRIAPMESVFFIMSRLYAKPFQKK